MAEEKNDEDLDLGVEKDAGSKKKLIIIILGAVLLLAGGGGVAWMMLSGEESADNAEEAVDAVEAEPEKGPATYHSMDPVFVVNLPAGGNAKMLQVGVQILTHTPEVVEFLKLNDPMIRHNLLNLMAEQQDSVLRERKGKEQLQAAILKSLNQTVKELGGSGKVETVYFTSFVMQ